MAQPHSGSSSEREPLLPRAAPPSAFHKLCHAVYRVYAYFSFADVRPLLDLGLARRLNASSAQTISPESFRSAPLSQEFTDSYDTQGKGHRGIFSDVMRAAIKVCWRSATLQLWWVTSNSIMRLAAPVLLRRFVIWIYDYRDGEAEMTEGWVLGVVLSLVLFLGNASFGRMFWYNNSPSEIRPARETSRDGSEVSFRLRFAATAAVHSKLLRINSSSASLLTAGHIVNLVAADLKQLSDDIAFLPFLITGPLETIAVLVMVSSVLGFLPALTGMSCVLIIIPIQSVLAKWQAHYHSNCVSRTDKRVDKIRELVTGILAVKMLSWEDRLEEDVQQLRRREQKYLLLKNSIQIFNSALPGVIQSLLVGVTFIVCRFTTGEFNVPDVLFAIRLMTMSRMVMATWFVEGVRCASRAWVVSKRLNNFLKTQETQLPLCGDRPVGTVEVEEADYGWSVLSRETNSAEHSSPLAQQSNGELAMKKTLSVPTFVVQPSELIGIVGAVGSGKSSLLSALLNEMHLLTPSGGVQLYGKVSYCSQMPWIVADTVRENITFGQPFEDERYRVVTESCALETDFNHLPSGDATALGERGVNVSGGQKARLALARAAYSQADIHLLDDPLSAVDPAVGKTLFEKCIGPKGLMKNATRILITHQHQYLPHCDRVFVVENRAVGTHGDWRTLTTQPFKTAASPQMTFDAIDTLMTADHSHSLADFQTAEAAADGGQLHEEEGKQEGRVASSVYLHYLRLMGTFSAPAAICLFIISQTFAVLTEWSIVHWAAADSEDQRGMKWVWIVITVTATSMITQLVSSLVLFILLMRSSTRLHDEMMHCVLHAPLKFFHVNPTGRILNRFSSDTSVQDNELNALSVALLWHSLRCLGAIVTISIAVPLSLPFIFLLVLLFVRVRRPFVVNSREIRRYNGITGSPVYSLLSDNIKGLTTIRAFQQEAMFQKRFIDALDRNASWVWASYMIGNWIGFRIDGISSVIILVTTVLAIVLAKQVSVELLGLALMYAINLCGVLQWTLRLTVDFENSMTAVERNIEYTSLEQEPPRAAEGGGEAPEGWPGTGSIEYRSVTASYRPGLDPVLKKLSFEIPGGSSVGLVGRTGSGKSSLLLTLFRLISINEGEILIDGVETSCLGTDVLRKKLAVIPQDPVLFGGTLRSNLDPWKDHLDARIWGALKNVHLESLAAEMGGLDAPIAESGSNLSVGQRQLLCLTRALLSDAKILALDEATANVDRETDSLIQESLRDLTAKGEKTLLVVAHRVDTVLDCQLLLVLQNGALVETGSPEALLKTKGVFASMVSAARRPMDAN